MSNFLLSQNTKLILDDTLPRTKPVLRALTRFKRDMEKAFLGADGEADTLIILKKCDLPAEQYLIRVEQKQIELMAGDDLGFIYALNFLSEKYLGILPLWFWNDQKITRRQSVNIPTAQIHSSQKRVKYRGWFINDEVLISHWRTEENPWEMAFEALLRLGGNLVIPGTDENSKLYADLASDMGLWITHHHAEPLGAQMFARAYPELEPSYLKYPELFEKLWRDGIERQKAKKIVWTIGFRGQGDCPFWENDPEYDTPQKRGALISKIMQLQCDMVREQVENAVFCTNLYGEIMELYRGGYLQIPNNVILISADNGYGKMVSRRQGNSNPRIDALPSENDACANHDNVCHGIYYHASFYDLQAANHITMLQNSMEFVESELSRAYKRGASTLWLINASNIKPHVYPLDFIANLWNNGAKNAKEHRRNYIDKYYAPSFPTSEKDGLAQQLEQCFEDYPKAAVSFGNNEDEHGGEQFYNYVTRDLIYAWMKSSSDAPCAELLWCADKESLTQQVEWYQNICEKGYARFSDLLSQCESLADKAGELWRDSLLLHAKIHTYCLHGALLFCRAYDKYTDNDYMEAFFLLGQAARAYEQASSAMREREHGKWNDFYANDCLCDVKETAYCLKRLMGYVRNIGDGPHFYNWQRKVTLPPRDQNVVLLTNTQNHMEDWELYIEMEKCRGL